MGCKSWYDEPTSQALEFMKLLRQVFLERIPSFQIARNIIPVFYSPARENTVVQNYLF